MRLIYNIIGRMAVALLPILALWSVIFYFAMVQEINDETDDSLEAYAEMIIRRMLAGVELPAVGDGSNNSFFIEVLSGPEALLPPSLAYSDSLVYIHEKRETEPARVLTARFAGNGGTAYRLVVTMPTFEREDLISSIFWHIVVLYIAVVLTVFLATILVFNRSMRPLYNLLAWLDRYLPGKGVRDFPDDSSVVEFSKLLNGAKSTIARAEAYLEQQKEFLGNASHELQTPLAVLGNRIEWMLNSTALSEEQAVELYKMQQSLRRLVRLNRTLLLLSKIENGQFPGVADVNIAQLVRDEAETYSDVYAGRGIECDVDLPRQLMVRMNEELATVFITNLLKNAFLHSPDGGRITVSFAGGRLVFANDGAGPLDRERLFDRFYKQGKTGSTGLGLALVGSIARYYKLNVEYSFECGKHCFEVAL